MIPVIGFPTFARPDLAQRMIDSIDYPVEHLVIVDNSGKGEFSPKPNPLVQKMWVLPMPYGVGPATAMNIVIKSTPHASYWLLASEDTWCEPGSLEQIHAEVDTNALNFFDTHPDWCFVGLGEGAVLRVGLCSELFYPYYYEDWDYERRLKANGVPIKRINAKINHNNSSTIASGYQEENGRTFPINQRLYQKRLEENDMGEGEWSLAIRRENSWD